MARSQATRLNLDPLLDEPVDWRYKSFPPGPAVPLRSVGDRGWSVLGGEFMLPVMVLKDSALQHNIELMARYCREHDFLLAPHGKTSMSPQLLKRQLEGGAWAVTAATMSQVRVWREFGVDRVILANELVEPASVRWIASELHRDPEFDFYCLVDSVAQVRLIESALEATALDRPLQVLLEVGFTGGRAGCRTPEQALEVARAVSASGRLTLAGVEAFEGIISSDSLNGTIEATDRFLSDMRALVERVDQAGLFARSTRVMVSAGGSAFPDRVVAAFGRPWDLSRPVELVLRSGCYITHDAVHYQQLSPFGGRIPETGPLKEALEVWGVVLSLPEPGLALIGFGKRDVPYDLELPVPRMIKSGGEAPRPFQSAAVVSGTNDQHAYLRIDGPENLKVGDLVGCGISHPCTAFDKWRLIPLVDDGYRVIDAILTYF
ncbi:MAG: hypothetical protein AUI15_34480 [Actinobacteria bacterium 13_2_20CM_2_66_6]|nr:MAG: hypothetical protein AUI15_34480 [Actinobacteria bacterium 13_2_20CM_2_66_6]